MNESEFMKEKAALLIAGHRVCEVSHTRDYTQFAVKGNTATHHVYLWADGTIECTCPDWTYQRRICAHLLAATMWHHARVLVGEA